MDTSDATERQEWDKLNQSYRASYSKSIFESVSFGIFVLIFITKEASHFP